MTHMARRLYLVALIAALALPIRAPAATPPDHALAVGTVIPAANDLAIGGWRQLYRGSWTRRVQHDGEIAESRECCFAVYEKGMALMVLRTEPVTRDARGESLTERIVKAKWITRRRDESVTDCQILWISPQLSLFDNRTETIRSVVIDNDEFVVIHWRDPGSACAFGD